MRCGRKWRISAQQIEGIKIVAEELNTALEEQAPIREVIRNVQTHYEEEYLN
ncbi:Uncharacterized protein NEOC65_000734 [Neochlamydia sp. AcF65]|uniref:hypothetical protein n=1 Tax=Neochlamydia sp. AcF65 TaxID=2795735 RepID=UPI001BC99AE4|nr:hypothetical protein [Neochlamydia sp. AcF65]MBS4165669.1 Uncharacterized protein [Neochlamydia sp. AcF65]